MQRFNSLTIPRSIACCTFVLLAACLCIAQAADAVMDWQDPLMVARSGAWPRMARLADGSWLLVHTLFPLPAPSQLVISRSTNNGATWTRIATVMEPGRKLDNGHLIVLPSCEVLLTGRSLIDGQSYQLPIWHSSDGGGHWIKWGMIATNEGAPGTLKGRGLWEPHLVFLSDGRITAVYASETHPGFSQVVGQTVSTNRGRTWGPETIAVAESGGGRLRPGMPVLIRMANGRYFLVYEVVGRGRGDVYHKTSDDGLTWSADLGALIPGQVAGPFALSLGSGDLLVTSCANIMSVSRDFGASWQTLDPPPFPLGFRYSWPALYEIGPKQVAAVVSSGSIRLRVGAFARP